jgi:hypothetical protein
VQRLLKALRKKAAEKFIAQKPPCAATIATRRWVRCFVVVAPRLRGYIAAIPLEKVLLHRLIRAGRFPAW